MEEEKMKIKQKRIDDGFLFNDVGLYPLRKNGKELVRKYNNCSFDEHEERLKILNELFLHFGSGSIEPPLNVCYGNHVSIGEDFFANMGLMLIDDGEITIGDRVMIGPNVTIVTSNHPIHPNLRKNGEMYTLPVIIEDNVWIGCNVVICAGVKVGSGSTIGAGSVVTHDIPSNVFAAGIPCKIIREITEQDGVYYHETWRIEDRRAEY